MMRTFTLIVLIVLLSGKLSVVAQENYDRMYNGFQNPPVEAFPNVYHWWLGGHVDTLRLKDEIISLKNAGIAGFTIFEIGSRDTVHVKSGPAFLSDESLQSIKYAVDLAGSLGMEVGLNTASSWNAGGNWLPPEHAAKSIYYSKKKVNGGKNLSLNLPFPGIPKKDAWGKPGMIKFGADNKPVYYEEIAVLAIPSDYRKTLPDTAGIIDVTSFFNIQTEQLNWEAPEGEWELWRFICSNSGENLVLPSKHSAGPIVDHFDADATEFHFMYMINRLQSVLGDINKSALKNLYMASYEAKGFTWTTTLPKVFERINSYNINKFLPALFVDTIFPSELTAQFKADFQSTLSELMINNFYIKSKEICNRYGLRNNCEAGGPGLPLHNVPVEPLKALGKGLDIPRGEFWINHSRFNDEGIDISRVVKEVSSASHIYNRELVEMEAFTTFQHWQEGPFEMKPFGDLAFCEGMNKVVIHGSTHNPSGTGYPGIVYHAGTHYNDKRVWWPKIKPFNEYLARISFILQEADFHADVLYYYGDTIPNYGGHKNSRFTAGPGYDYEIINTDILLKLYVENGKLRIPGLKNQYSLLALTDEYEINPVVLLKLQDLLKQGAIILGKKPQKVATRKIKPENGNIENLLNELWSENGTSKNTDTGNTILSGIKPSAVLNQLGITQDFSYVDENLNVLDYTHYVSGNIDFYFLRNTTENWISREIKFRQPEKSPEIWDPVSGKIVPVPVFKNTGGYTMLPLTLAPYGSTFIVFNKNNNKPQFEQFATDNQHPPLLQYHNDGISIWDEGLFELSRNNRIERISNYKAVNTLKGPWEVFFPTGWGAPEKAIFPELTSWSESEETGIKYFSGIARYEKSFVHQLNQNAPGNSRIILDLGDLSHVGEVWLNDQALGIVWAKPYRIDVTDIIKPGPNKLVIEIANTWSNRLKGDAVTGQNYTKTNISSTVVEDGFFIEAPWKDVPLIKSGLFGPVTLTTINIF